MNAINKKYTQTNEPISATFDINNCLFYVRSGADKSRLNLPHGSLLKSREKKMTLLNGPSLLHRMGDVKQYQSLTALNVD